MRTIIKLFSILCLTAWSTTIKSQSALTMDVSQLYVSFKFKDSQNNQLTKDYLGIYTGMYSFGYRYLFDFGFIIKPSVGIRNAGSNLIYDDMNYSWRLKYAEAKLGLGYTYKFNKIGPYFLAYGYYSYLIEGNQVLNNEHFNIIESDLLNKQDYGIIFSPGVEIEFSDYLSSFFEFNYLLGLNNIEKDEGQKTTNIAYGLTIGLLLSFTK